MTEAPRTLGPGGCFLVALFLGSGTLHLVRPEVFAPIVPHALPVPRLLVIVSGVAEIACALGLLGHRTRRSAGLVSALLLIALFPANLQMAWDAWHDWRSGEVGGWYAWGTLARLPLQLPMIWWAWRVRLRTR